LVRSFGGERSSHCTDIAFRLVLFDDAVPTYITNGNEIHEVLKQISLGLRANSASYYNPDTVIKILLELIRNTLQTLREFRISGLRQWKLSF
jgi:hypothetical protein